MKNASVFAGFLLLALVACTAQASPTSNHEVSEADIIILAHDLPWELRELYDVIVDHYQDDIKKENCIWQAFELLQHKKYKHYVWFYDWLVYQSGWSGRTPGRHTPRRGGLTPRGGPGGRTHGHGHGRGGPGGRTKKRGGPPGGRTRGGGRHRHGRH